MLYTKWKWVKKKITSLSKSLKTDKDKTLIIYTEESSNFSTYLMIKKVEAYWSFYTSNIKIIAKPLILFPSWGTDAAAQAAGGGGGCGAAQAPG